MNRKTKRGHAGFTLIELLVVISILGIITMIAVPVFLGQRTKAMRTEAMTNLEALRLLQEQYFAENAAYTASAGTCAQDNPDNIDDIQDLLPGFKPGKPEQLYFSYCIQQNLNYSLVANTPCFVARAFGNSRSSAVNGQELRVDCNNEKDF